MKTELDKAWIAIQGHDHGYGHWDEIVHEVCGPHASIEWTETSCIVLGTMEFFDEPKEN